MIVGQHQVRLILYRTYYSFLNDDCEEKMKCTEFLREIPDDDKPYVSGFLANIHKIHEKPSVKDKERVAINYLEHYESEPNQ